MAASEREAGLLARVAANHLFLAQFEPMRAALLSLRRRTDPDLAADFLRAPIADDPATGVDARGTLVKLLDLGVARLKREVDDYGEPVEEVPVTEEDLRGLWGVVLDNAELFDALCAGVSRQIGLDSGFGVNVLLSLRRSVQLAHLDAMKALVMAGDVESATGHIRFLCLENGVEEDSYKVVLGDVVKKGWEKSSNYFGKWFESRNRIITIYGEALQSSSPQLVQLIQIILDDILSEEFEDHSISDAHWMPLPFKKFLETLWLERDADSDDRTILTEAIVSCKKDLFHYSRLSGKHVLEVIMETALSLIKREQLQEAVNVVSLFPLLQPLVAVLGWDILKGKTELRRKLMQLFWTSKSQALRLQEYSHYRAQTDEVLFDVVPGIKFQDAIELVVYFMWASCTYGRMHDIELMHMRYALQSVALSLGEMEKCAGDGNEHHYHIALSYLKEMQNFMEAIESTPRKIFMVSIVLSLLHMDDTIKLPQAAPPECSVNHDCCDSNTESEGKNMVISFVGLLLDILRHNVLFKGPDMDQLPSTGLSPAGRQALEWRLKHASHSIEDMDWRLSVLQRLPPLSGRQWSWKEALVVLRAAPSKLLNVCMQRANYGIGEEAVQRFSLPAEDKASLELAEWVAGAYRRALVEDALNRATDNPSVARESDILSFRAQLGPLTTVFVVFDLTINLNCQILLCIDVAATSARSGDMCRFLLDEATSLLSEIFPGTSPKIGPTYWDQIQEVAIILVIKCILQRLSGILDLEGRPYLQVVFTEVSASLSTESSRVGQKQRPLGLLHQMIDDAFRGKRQFLNEAFLNFSISGKLHNVARAIVDEDSDKTYSKDGTKSEKKDALISEKGTVLGHGLRILKQASKTDPTASSVPESSSDHKGSTNRYLGHVSTKPSTYLSNFIIYIATIGDIVDGTDTTHDFNYFSLVYERPKDLLCAFAASGDDGDHAGVMSPRPLPNASQIRVAEQPGVAVAVDAAAKARDKIAHNLLHRGFAGSDYGRSTARLGTMRRLVSVAGDDGKDKKKRSAESRCNLAGIWLPSSNRYKGSLLTRLVFEHGSTDAAAKVADTMGVDFVHEIISACVPPVLPPRTGQGWACIPILTTVSNIISENSSTVPKSLPPDQGWSPHDSLLSSRRDPLYPLQLNLVKHLAQLSSVRAVLACVFGSSILSGDSESSPTYVKDAMQTTEVERSFYEFALEQSERYPTLNRWIQMQSNLHRVSESAVAVKTENEVAVHQSKGKFSIKRAREPDSDAESELEDVVINGNAASSTLESPKHDDAKLEPTAFISFDWENEGPYEKAVERLINEGKLTDALAVSDRCLRNGASDKLLRLLIDQREERSLGTGQFRPYGSRNLGSNTWQYCLRLRDKKLAAQLALKYLHSWNLDAATNVLTMCICHLPENDPMRSKVLHMKQSLQRYGHIMSADDHYTRWQEVEVDCEDDPEGVALRLAAKGAVSAALQVAESASLSIDLRRELQGRQLVKLLTTDPLNGGGPAAASRFLSTLRDSNDALPVAIGAMKLLPDLRSKQLLVHFFLKRTVGNLSDAEIARLNSWALGLRVLSLLPLPSQQRCSSLHEHPQLILEVLLMMKQLESASLVLKEFPSLRDDKLIIAYAKKAISVNIDSTLREPRQTISAAREKEKKAAIPAKTNFVQSFGNFQREARKAFSWVPRDGGTKTPPKDIPRKRKSSGSGDRSSWEAMPGVQEEQTPVYPSEGQDRLPFVSAPEEWVLTGEPDRDNTTRSCHRYESSPDIALFKPIIPLIYVSFLSSASRHAQSPLPALARCHRNNAEVYAVRPTNAPTRHEHSVEAVPLANLLAHTHWTHSRKNCSLPHEG
uniref:Uncharacterized protein n=1 Tax=Aegilops tauschii TaxID=37682 RepID=M8C4G1_AEGTA